MNLAKPLNISEDPLKLQEGSKLANATKILPNYLYTLISFLDSTRYFLYGKLLVIIYAIILNKTNRTVGKFKCSWKIQMHSHFYFSSSISTEQSLSLGKS